MIAASTGSARFRWRIALRMRYLRAQRLTPVR
jgi:hypothetical protein